MVARMSASSALVQEQAPRRYRGARFTRRHVMLAAGVLLVLEVAGFSYFVAGTHGWIVPLHQPVSTDFVSFFAAGRLATDGTPALVYDHAAHYAAEQAATEPGVPYNYFYYPPVFLLVCVVLARLPYPVAFAAFQMGSLVPCLLVVRRILRERGWAVLVPLLAFPPVYFTLGTGQNAFLTATLFGTATLLVDRRPALAGILLGALCYKPHFGLLIPVALIAAGRWRVIAAAAATGGGLVGLSAAVFGWGVWRAFLDAAGGVRGGLRRGCCLPGDGRAIWRHIGARRACLAGLRAPGNRRAGHGNSGLRNVAAGNELAGPRRHPARRDTTRSPGGDVLRPDAVRDGTGLVGSVE